MFLSDEERKLNVFFAKIQREFLLLVDEWGLRAEDVPRLAR